MRKTLPIACAVLFGVLTVAVVTQQLPLRQNLEILKEGLIRADKVKEGLYVIRGPFLPCMTGCRPGQTSDGLIHESGDVAVRVTPAGLIVVDDKRDASARRVGLDDEGVRGASPATPWRGESRTPGRARAVVDA